MTLGAIRGIDCLLSMDPSVGEGVLGMLRDAAVVWEGHRIVYVGSDRDAPDVPGASDGRGGLVLPGLIDSHTHAVWAGSRFEEFEQRLAGVSYTEILEQGGGILSTVAATRSATEDALLELAVARLRTARSRGVTTMEVKSGYGLNLDTELRLLRVAREAGRRAGVRVVPTFLGAHAIPAEYRGDRAAYVQLVIDEMLPSVVGLADYADVYVDRGAFTVEEGHAILLRARALGLGVRIHAEQVTLTGAAAMAAGLGAASCDHLERIDDVGIAAMAAAGCVATMLPGAMTFLRDPSPPVDRLREAGVAMAVATDLNPGSSPVVDPWACMTLAAVSMRLTVPEVLSGMTRVAAQSLGLPTAGRIVVGGPADLAHVAPPWGAQALPAALIGQLGGVVVRETVASGRRSTPAS